MYTLTRHTALEKGIKLESYSSATPKSPKDINDRDKIMHSFPCLLPYSVLFHEHFQDKISMSTKTADLEIPNDSLYNRII